MAEVRAPAGAGEGEQYAAAGAEAFGGEPEHWRSFLEPLRAHGTARVAVDGGRVVAGAIVLPTAQHFGGRPVGSGAVSGVFVSPGHRGRGLARAVLGVLGPVLAGTGPLAVLSTGSPGLYRPWGWELVGARTAYTLPGQLLAGLRAADGELVREPGQAERARLREALAPGWDGPMRRPDWWEEIAEHWLGPRPAQRVGWRQAGRLTGWLALEPDRAAGRLVVTELWAATPEAVTGLASFLGDGRPRPLEVRFEADALPADTELLHLLDAYDVTASAGLAWMLRLVEPAAALAARGWPPALEVTAELEIQAGWRPPERLVLEVGGGGAAVTRAAGAGTVRVGAGALTAWYAGGLRLRRAVGLGLAEGPAEVLAALDAATGDRVSWLPERF